MKEHTFNQLVLSTYSDYSRKIVFQLKLNQNAVLAKVNPTTKACEKFLVNAQLEFKIDLIPELINVLRNYQSSSLAQQDFVMSHDTKIRERKNVLVCVVRLLVDTKSYSRRVEILEDEDMEFSDDPTPVNDEQPPPKPKEELNDMFGTFFIKKTTISLIL